MNNFMYNNDRVSELILFKVKDSDELYIQLPPTELLFDLYEKDYCFNNIMKERGSELRSEYSAVKISSLDDVNIILAAMEEIKEIVKSRQTQANIVNK